MSAYQASPGQPMPQGEDPGRTLGIVGLVLAIVGSVIGLVISIIALSKSRKAGYKNGLALAGVIIGAITTIVTIAVIIVSVVALSKVASECKTLGPGSHVVNGVTYTCS